MICTSCQKNKKELRSRKSRLMDSKLFLCNSCWENNREPRWIIVLYGRSHGVESIKLYIDEHRYVGDEILAKELA